MKLTALHESTVAGYGMAYQILGARPKELIPDLFRPKGVERWYHRESALTLRHREQIETEFPRQPVGSSTLAEGLANDTEMQRVTVPVGFIEADLIILRQPDGVVNGFWDLTEDAYKSIKDDPYEQTHLLDAAARILYAIVEWDESNWRFSRDGYVRRLNIHGHDDVPTRGQIEGLNGHKAQACDDKCSHNRPDHHAKYIRCMKLNEAQQEVVAYTGGPLLVLACPGSGKTRSLTELMIALLERGVDAVNILAVTFTNKAADEMAARVNKRVPSSGVHISTFHSLCAHILRSCAHLIGFKRNFTICDEGDQTTLMRRLVKLAGLDPKEHDPKHLIAKLEKKKNTLTTDADFYKACDPIEASVFKTYQERLKSANSMDFSDLLVNVIAVFDKVPAVQQAYSTRFEYVLVDEMQDTNLAQLELVRRLAKVHGNIVVVGDSDQTVYSWRQARPENILHFDKYFPGSRTIKLEMNYRSTPEILAVANKLIDKNTKRKKIQLQATRESGEPVKYIEYQNMEDQAEEIARIIDNRRLNGHQYQDIAILCRVNALTRSFEESFRRNDIPYVLIGAFGFYDRREVKTALAYMKFLANTEDVLAFEEAVSTPSRGVGTSSITKIVQEVVKSKEPFVNVLDRAGEIKGIPKKAVDSLKSFMQVCNSWDDQKPVTSLTNIFEASGLLDNIRATDRQKNEHREENILEVLRGFATYCRRKNSPNLAQYLQEISLLSSADQEDKDSSVKLMTVHAAKGLEFPIVIVPGLEEETLPHHRSIASGDVEEERRICYVAVTRAEDQLILCRALETFQNGGPVGSVPSRFLIDMGLVKGF